MGLRDYKPRTTKIVTDDGQGAELELRGLSVEDLTTLAATLGPQMAMLFSSAMKQAHDAQDNPEDLENFDISLAIVSALKDVPELVAACIALASDDYTEETVSLARRLPVPDQVAAIEAIFALTFRSESEVKKLMESVSHAVEKLALTLTEARLPLSRIGIGDSEAA